MTYDLENLSIIAHSDDEYSCYSIEIPPLSEEISHHMEYVLTENVSKDETDRQRDRKPENLTLSTNYR